MMRVMRCHICLFLATFIISHNFLFSNCGEIRNEIFDGYNSTSLLSRKLAEHSCDTKSADNPSYGNYFSAMRNIYGSRDQGTCIPIHLSCGWNQENNQKEQRKQLPLFVLSVGLEGAGHHLWTELFDKPVFDCVWKNARHYHRDIADGVPRTTKAKLEDGLREQLALRKQNNMPPCRSIYDSEDSFPTGAIRKRGRLFMRPDIVNLQQLDGVLFNIKYLIILRNVTDTALSALRRNFFVTVDEELRTVEHTLTYLEAALRSVPCDKMFIAHYEHILTDPTSYLSPLSDFLQLEDKARLTLATRLSAIIKANKHSSSSSSSHTSNLPKRKKHKLTQYAECSSGGGGAGVGASSEDECYRKVCEYPLSGSCSTSSLCF